MADNDDELKNRDEKNANKTVNTCKHCRKSAVSVIKCGKCSYHYHPACLIQAATQKSARCRHVPEYVIGDEWTTEKQLLLQIIKLLEEKNQILQENNNILQENNQLLKEKNRKNEEKQEKFKVGIPQNDLGQGHENKQKQNGHIRQQRNPEDDKRKVDTNHSTNTNYQNGEQRQRRKTETAEDCTFELPSSELPVLTTDIDTPKQSEVMKSYEKNNEWQEVNYRNRQKIQKLERNERPNPLQGTQKNENHPLKPAERMSYLFLTNLTPETKPEEVIEYLKTKQLEDRVKCEKMRTRKEKVKSSFKLIVPQKNKENFLSETLWPKGVSINHFLNIQSRKVTRSQRN